MGSQRHEDKRLIAAWVPSHIHAELEEAKRTRGEDTTTFILRAVQQRLAGEPAPMGVVCASPEPTAFEVRESPDLEYGSVSRSRRKKSVPGTESGEVLPEVSEWAREMRRLRRGGRDESMDALKSEFRHWVKETEMRSYELGRRLEQMERMLKDALSR